MLAAAAGDAAACALKGAMNRTLPGALVVWTSEAYDEFDYRASESLRQLHLSLEISCPQLLVPFISFAEPN